ncbi:MAG: alpha/beta hydrolase [Pseudomonadota bacterium]
MTDLPPAERIAVGDFSLSVHQAGPEAGPAVMLVHGWPEIAYSWKRQIGPLADAGYRVIAPDLKGFGASDAPTDKAHYDVRAMTGDLVGLLDALEIDRAVFVGHDWGGALVWPTAQLHPDRVAGVVGVCTPHRSPAVIEPVSILQKRYGDTHYIVQFQEEGAMEALFTGEEERFFRTMFRRSGPRAVWEKLGPAIYDLPRWFKANLPADPKAMVMGDEDLAVYVDAYKRSGFHGGLNLYRNIDANWETLKAVPSTIERPALWIGAADDPFLPLEWAVELDDLIPDLEKTLIEKCGHWMMWERPAELNAALLDWLDRRFPT